MPPVDLETFVSVCGGSSSDRKIACETLADDSSDVSPDFPPESFWLSKDAEFDWFDRNAFLERKESTKGNVNSSHSNSSSQRFSFNLKSKAAIIGLPKTQKTNYVDARRSYRGQNIRLFPPPKRSESVGKSGAAMMEPSSPKVSCIGRVRSKRGRRKSSKSKKEAVKPPERTSSSGRGKRSALYSGLMSLFRSDHRRRDKSSVRIDEPAVKSSSRKSKTAKACAASVSCELEAEPPGLGGMTRFASGRRSESWSAEEINVAKRDSIDSDRHAAKATGGSTRLS